VSIEPPVFLAAQKFKEHAIHQAVRALGEKMRAADIPQLRDLPRNVRGTLVRTRWVIRDLKRRLGQVDPLLVRMDHIDQANKGLSGVAGAFEAFTSDPAGQHHLLEDQASALTHFLPGIRSSGFTPEQADDFSEFLSDMGGVSTEARKELEKLKTDTEGTRTKLKEANREAARLKQEIESQRGRMDDAINTGTQAFNDGETKRNQAAAEALKQEQKQTAEWLAQEKAKAADRNEEYRKQHEEQLAGAKVALEASVEEHLAKSNEALTEINVKLEEARALVRLVGDEVTTGSYEEVAKRELRSAQTMRSLAVALFLAGAVAMLSIGISFSLMNNDALDLWTILLRSLFGAILFVPAGYCAREAARHWVSERAHRRIALELKSIHPFLEPLESAERLKIIQARAAEYFGNRMPPEFDAGKAKPGDSGVTGKDLLDALKAKSR